MLTRYKILFLGFTLILSICALAQNYSHLLITEAIENPTTILNINKNILTTIHNDYEIDPLDITKNLNDLLLGIFLFDNLHEFYDFLFETNLELELRNHSLVCRAS